MLSWRDKNQGINAGIPALYLLRQEAGYKITESTQSVKTSLHSPVISLLQGRHCQPPCPRRLPLTGKYRRAVLQD